MPEVTVGPKHQIVIPREVRRRLKAIYPGAKVSVVAKDERTIEVRPAPKSWTDYMRGLGKEVWRGIDTDRYIEELRSEWERKPE